MKKLFTLFVLLAGLAPFVVFGQTCTPAVVSANGIFPDSATNFLPAYQNTYYEQLITVRVPADTIVPPLPIPVPIDNIKIVSLTGLPTGLSYACVPADCAFPGGQTNCGIITGTVNDTVGPYFLNVTVQPTVGGIPFTNQTIDYYKIVVNPASSLPVWDKLGFSIAAPAPNPANGTTRVRFTSASGSRVDVALFNAIGERVIATQIQAQRGENQFDLNTENLPSGIYFLNAIQAGKVQTKRLTVAH